MNDFITQGYGQDHIRKRMAITPAAYGCAIVAFKRAHRRVPDKLKAYAACVILGAVLGVWLAHALAGG